MVGLSRVLVWQVLCGGRGGVKVLLEFSRNKGLLGTTVQGLVRNHATADLE